MARQRLHLVGQIQRPGKRPENVDLVVDNPEDILVYTDDALNRVYERIESGKAFHARGAAAEQAMNLENPSSSGVIAVVYAVEIMDGSASAQRIINLGYQTAALGTSVTETNLLTAAADAACSATSATSGSSPSTNVYRIGVTPQRLTSSTDAAPYRSYQLDTPIAISEGDHFRMSCAGSSPELGFYWYEL